MSQKAEQRSARSSRGGGPVAGAGDTVGRGLTGGKGGECQNGLSGTPAAEGAALVQPFVPEIVSEGEWSLFFFGGQLSHVILKSPAPHDYRIQLQFGGTATRREADARLLNEAQAVLAALPIAPLYVRIDGVRIDGGLHLMEVEAIEPYLFLGAAPEGFDHYLAAVAAEARR